MARARCMDFGSGYDLAVLTDSGEEPEARTRVVSSGHDAWVGLSDRETEGTFRWLDGTAAPSESFIANEGEGADCFVLDHGDLRFQDRNCREDNNFICEAPIDD